jgi:hypothetical protein|tara:strand:- start:43 stop:180 length:138 start_codon:yes stop_codon:yes gene_type:complete
MSMSYPEDFFEYGFVSSCCGADVIHGDICYDCKEHCDLDEIEEED